MPYGAVPGYSKVAEDNGTLTTTSLGTKLTTAATANVKGAYFTVVTSSAFAAHGFVFQFGQCSTGIDFMVDIAIGAAGSEIVIVPNVCIGSGTGACARKSGYLIPIAIPAGTRISARAQGTSLTTAVYIKIHLLGDLAGGMDSYGKMLTYGANTATTQYTSVDPGAVANTKGAWTQLTASTTYPIKGFMFDTSNLVQTARTGANWLLDIGIGAAASEIVILPNYHIECVATDDTILHTPSIIWPISIPAGTAISARCQSSLITATVRLLPVGILAFS